MKKNNLVMKIWPIFISIVKKKKEKKNADSKHLRDFKEISQLQQLQYPDPLIQLCLNCQIHQNGLRGMVVKFKEWFFN